jgi:hypothetical protein
MTAAVVAARPAGRLVATVSPSRAATASICQSGGAGSRWPALAAGSIHMRGSSTAAGSATGTRLPVAGITPGTAVMPHHAEAYPASSRSPDPGAEALSLAAAAPALVASLCRCS